MNNLSNKRLAELANKGMICICQDEEYQSMARELLARREAAEKPALYRWRYPEDSVAGATAWQPVPVEQYESFMRLIASKDPDVEVEKLYAAPPMPVWFGIDWAAPAAPDGWALVPIELTDEMGEAIAKEARCCGGIAFDIYQAMIAAAPKPEVRP